MRVVRASMGLILVLCCVCLRADESDPQKITLVGTIHRVMAMSASGFASSSTKSAAFPAA